MTIASIITAPGDAAVSIIKISGKDAWTIAEKLTGKNFEEKILELSWVQSKDEKIDQVLILPFKAPRSQSGEDIIEIHCHGGSWITNKILDLVLEQGAQLAKPGEFTERAVMNGKLDLSQAEAIMDIVNARSKASGENAIKLYSGELGSEIKTLRLEILDLLGEVTASIDFPDEVGDYDKNKFIHCVSGFINEIDSLLEGEKEGHILRNGYKVALTGNPNAGKSTLLNALLKKDRAIVTEIAGTTRDLIEEAISINGVPIILVDTAGIRESTDTVEKIGIERTLTAIEEADLVIELLDLSAGEKPSIKKQENHLVIGNKSDVTSNNPSASEEPQEIDLKISALKKENIDQLKDLIAKKINAVSSSDASIKINQRQADLLRKAKSCLEKCLKSSSLAEDFWTIDLRDAAQKLGEITGETLTEELLDNIFSRFCIGK